MYISIYNEHVLYSMLQLFGSFFDALPVKLALTAQLVTFPISELHHF